MQAAAAVPVGAEADMVDAADLDRAQHHCHIILEIGCPQRPALVEFAPFAVEIGLFGGGQRADPLLFAEQLGARTSEEHTSELQSLMRTSYSVFCLNKQKRTRNKRKGR